MRLSTSLLRLHQRKRYREVPQPEIIEVWLSLLSFYHDHRLDGR